MIQLPGIIEPPCDRTYHPKDDALVTLRFMIPARRVWDKKKERWRIKGPVSKNEMHIHMPSIPSQAKIITAEARHYMATVARIGRYAAADAGWPLNLCAPRRVRLTIQIFGTRHDEGAADSIIRDALEGVLYRNDNVVEKGPQIKPPPSPEPFVIVTAELLEVWPERLAQKRLADALERDRRHEETRR